MEHVAPCSWWSSAHGKMWTCWSWSRGGCEDVQRVQHLSYGDKLRKLGLFRLEREGSGKTLENLPVPNGGLWGQTL